MWSAIISRKSRPPAWATRAAPATTEKPLGFDQSDTRSVSMVMPLRWLRSARKASTRAASCPVTTVTRRAPAAWAWRTPSSISGTPQTGVSGLESDRLRSRLP